MVLKPFAMAGIANGFIVEVFKVFYTLPARLMSAGGAEGLEFPQAGEGQAFDFFQ